jgi:hypothetical protein
MPDVATWLAEADKIQASEDIVKKRTAAAQEIGQKIEGASLVRTVLGDKNESEIGKIVDVIKRHDVGFAHSSPTFHARTVAAIAIANLLEKRSTSADEAAIALFCTVDLLRTAFPFPKLLPLASGYIYAQSDEAYKIEDPIKVAPNQLPLSAVTKAKKSRETTADSDETLTLIAAIEELANAQAAANRNFKEVIQAIQDSTRVLKQDSDFLWWSLSLFSKTREKFYREISVVEAAWLTALELAQLTALRPGPPYVKVLLARTLGACSDYDGSAKFKIEDIVAAAPEDAGGTISQTLEDLSPIHGALKYSQRYKTTEWQKVYEADQPYDVTFEMTVLDAAERIYYEQLLSR